MSGATNNKDGTRKRWIHGRSVQDGKLRFLSVSSLEKGDSSKPTGCLRRWWYQYIGGIKEESQSEAMLRGEKVHAEIAHYLTTGEQVLSSLALAGIHMIPEPGPDLLVEHDIVPDLNGKSGLEIAPLRANGVPLVGAIDLLHQRGTNKGTESIEEMHDPKGTIEVLDWKVTSNIENAKKGQELLKSIQMAGYGKYVFETNPQAQLVRLSHGYFPTRGVPRKTTIRVDRDQIEKSWEHANRVASSIGDAAKETNVDLVEANTDACHSYGRPCPAAGVCKAFESKNVSKFVANIIPTENLTKNMSIFAQIRARANTPSNPPTTTQREIISPLVESSSTNESEDDKIKAEIARLAAQERASKGPELVPPDVPKSNPIIASKPQLDTGFTQAMAQAMVEEVPEPKKRGRKKKEPVPTPVPPPVVEPPPTVPEEVPPEELPIPGKINFYVDCSPESGCESLWPLVDHIMKLMCEEAKVDDIRLSVDERFDFGRWKGVLAKGILKTPLDSGNYGLLHANSDVGLVVVEVMRKIARDSGGEVVMGAR